MTFLPPLPRIASLLSSFGLALSFAFCAHASYRTDYVVSQDGKGDFRRIQDAIDDCKSFPYERITIRVKEGRYYEKVTVPAWNTKLSIIGEGKVVLTYDSHFTSVDRGRNSTFFTATLEVLANDFIGENLTIENSSGPVGQAIALRVEGDRAAFYGCRLLGNQDTLYVAGEGSRQYFRDCYIEGTTDYIFGEATAFFENCELRSKADSYLTAASTPESEPFGLVFRNCRLSAAKGVTQVFLGRPWRKHAKTVFVNCEYGPFIDPEGWGDWGLEDPGATVFYAESRSSVAEANRSQRAAWAKLLAKDQESGYGRETVLGDWISEKEE